MTQETHLVGLVRQLHAVEVLEYEDKNWLHHGTNPKVQSEQKQELICRILGAARDQQSELQRLKTAMAQFLNA